MYLKVDKLGNELNMREFVTFDYPFSDSSQIILKKYSFRLRIIFRKIFFNATNFWRESLIEKSGCKGCLCSAEPTHSSQKTKVLHWLHWNLIWSVKSTLQYLQTETFADFEFLTKHFGKGEMTSVLLHKIKSSGLEKTSSPGLNFVTFGPTLTTTPATSWPRMTGSL